MINRILNRLLVLLIVITLSFSIIPIKIQAKGKSVLKVSDKNIELTIGESIIINITVAKSVKIIHAEEKSNSKYQIISYKWKTKEKLKITGLTKGKTKIILTNSYNNEKVKINVSVKISTREKEIKDIINSIGDLSPTPLSNIKNTTIINNASTIEENYEVLAEYLKAYGTTNDSGESYIVVKTDRNDFFKISYNNSEDEFIFALKDKNKGIIQKNGKRYKGEGIVFLYITPSDYEYAFVKIAHLLEEAEVGYSGTGYFDPVTYTANSKMDFEIENNSMPSSKLIYEQVDILLKLLLVEAQIFFINNNLNLNLSNLGFEAFNESILQY